jgi:hypothetical protein
MHTTCDGQERRASAGLEVGHRNLLPRKVAKRTKILLSISGLDITLSKNATIPEEFLWRPAGLQL